MAGRWQRLIPGVLLMRSSRKGVVRLYWAKAQLTGITPDWPGLMLFATQVAVVGSLLRYAFILTWLFGREYVDRTAHQLMALPVSRTAIVMAKLGVYAAWGVLL